MRKAKDSISPRDGLVVLVAGSQIPWEQIHVVLKPKETIGDLKVLAGNVELQDTWAACFPGRGIGRRVCKDP